MKSSGQQGGLYPCSGACLDPPYQAGAPTTQCLKCCLVMALTRFSSQEPPSALEHECLEDQVFTPRGCAANPLLKEEQLQGVNYSPWAPGDRAGAHLQLRTQLC